MEGIRSCRQEKLFFNNKHNHGPAAATWQVRSPRYVCKVWKHGIWTLLVSDYTKLFPRIFGHSALYTPLPPLPIQEPGLLRLLVHRQDDASTDPVYEKTSKTGSLLRIAHILSTWRKYKMYIPEELQQVVVIANGIAGIAPMLQTIHTLLEVRRGDGLESRRPNLHVVWCRETVYGEKEDEMAQLSTKLIEDSAADEIASAELERLRLLHPANLVIESVDVGSTFPQAAKVVESPSRRRRLAPRIDIPLNHLISRLNPFGKGGSDKLLLISGSRQFAESLSGFNDDRASILAKAKEAGWEILDLSKTRVYT